QATGLAGLGLAGGSLIPGYSVENPGESSKIPQFQRFNMSGFAAPPMERVRIGIIGMGQRGPAHMITMSHVEGVEIKALCDIRPEKVLGARKKLEGTSHQPDVYTGEEDWKRVCERDDIDLVIITTPWYMHAKMSVYAMLYGKHVATEVPAAATIEECWDLVRTAERTKRHCMMMENYCYLPFQLLTLNLARDGFFGEVVHGDCAYNTSKMGNNFSKTMYWDMWWLRQYGSRKGNLYPTHGLGPVSTIMNINRGDRFDYLTSVETADFMMRAKAIELAGKDDFYKPFAEMEYRGNMSTTTIRTIRGRTITIQHDATSPSPHNLIHGIYGTHGAALYDPQPPRLCKGNHKWMDQEEFRKIEERYTPKIIRQVSELAAQVGAGHGGTDLLEDWRLVDCLRNGLPLDQDVYDAAAWSSIVPLSHQSVLNRSIPVEVPDFTAGYWRSNLPNMDINLERGGNTRVVL
ncbi:MAG: Gfo/Idh/MocA family oxidoreductase, partial [Bacteroidales bacterium]